MGGKCCKSSRSDLKCHDSEKERNENASEGAVCMHRSEGAAEGHTDEAEQNVEEPLGEPVILHIYNLQRNVDGSTRGLGTCLGLGIYHTGIEVFSTEWAFGGSTRPRPGVCGIISSTPKRMVPSHLYVESKVLGHLPVGVRKSNVEVVLKRLRPDWGVCTYSMLWRNCNHFTKAFRNELVKEFPCAKLKKIPSYINRAARFARILLPASFIPPVRDPIAHGPQGAGTKKRQGGQPREHAAEGSDHGAECAGSDGGRRKMQERLTPFTREELQGMTVRTLKTLLWLNNVSWDGCLEKEDMIKVFLEHQGKQLKQKGVIYCKGIEPSSEGSMLC
uniref:Uncharacterized protein TCIL3000_11_13790 n=1 Tax=Trypanosoma congolense (strain IL3000) TaxID=1068625 RepID=G0V2K1_TRYCI|nr:unnamed protein product [Trypanosoma congolense IL3000]